MLENTARMARSGTPGVQPALSLARRPRRPINTRYGEVFWQGLPAVPLPKEIVERYAGKVSALLLGLFIQRILSVLRTK